MELITDIERIGWRMVLRKDNEISGITVHVKRVFGSVLEPDIVPARGCTIPNIPASFAEQNRMNPQRENES
jgi:hypothetical protein